jgi:hypothetical protein
MTRQGIPRGEASPLDSCNVGADCRCQSTEQLTAGKWCSRRSCSVPGGDVAGLWHHIPWVVDPVATASVMMLHKVLEAPSSSARQPRLSAIMRYAVMRVSVTVMPAVKGRGRHATAATTSLLFHMHMAVNAGPCRLLSGTRK